MRKQQIYGISMSISFSLYRVLHTARLSRRNQFVVELTDLSQVCHCTMTEHLIY